MASTIDEHWQDALPDPESPLGGLGWLLALACVFNFFVFPILRAIEGGNDAIVFLAGAALGMFSAQLGALTLWLVWGPGPFLQRLAIHWLGALALFAAWALGFAIALGAEAPRRELPAIWGAVLCSLPLVSLAAQLPLWPLRTHLGWRVEKGSGVFGEIGSDKLDEFRSPKTPDPLASARQPLAIRDILIGTVATAVALAGIRIVAALTDAQQAGGQLDPGFWLGWGMAVLVTAAVSLLGFLPAMCLLLRGEEPALRVGLWLVYVAVAALVTIVIIASIVGGGSDAEPFVGLFCLLFSFSLTMLIPLWLARSRGWRLVMPGDPAAVTPPAAAPPRSPVHKVAPPGAVCKTQSSERGPS